MKITHRIGWGLPYCYSEFEYEDTEEPDYAVMALDAFTLEQAYRDLMPKPEPRAPYEPGEPEDRGPAEHTASRDYSPGVDHRGPSRPAQRPQGRDTGVYCPEHANAVCQPSKPEYNRDGDRFFHALDPRDQYRNEKGETVKNHSLYWRQTVDGNGQSNEGREMPASRRPVAAGRRPTQRNADYECDIDPSDLPF